MTQFQGTYKDLMLTSQQLARLKNNSIIVGLMDKSKIGIWRTKNADAITLATKVLTDLWQKFAKKDEAGQPIKKMENGVFVGWYFDTEEIELAYKNAVDDFFNKEITIYL